MQRNYVHKVKFGDWKLPLYIYITIPSIAVFGLNEFAVRFPSALLGTITVLLLYFLVEKLMEGKNEVEKKFNDVVPLLSSFFLAILPWHVFMSRNASESNVAVFLTTAGLLLFFKSFKKHIYLIPSCILLILPLYTYHGNHIFSTLLIIVLALLYWRKIIHNTNIAPSGVVLFILFGMIVSQTLFGADKTKISGLFPLGDIARVHNEIELKRARHNSMILGKLIHNKFTYLGKTIANNYIRGFSPEFLVVTGGANPQHTIPDFGNLYFWQMICIPLALFFLFYRKIENRWFLLFWLLISPIAASITRDAPHTNRMMGFLPLPAILSAYGLNSLIFYTRAYMRKFLALSAFGVICFYFALYLDAYFVQFPKLATKQWGGIYKNMSLSLSKYSKTFPEITIARPTESPYIYYVFYTQYDPYRFQSNVLRYPETDEGFQHVHKLDTITFENIDWEYAHLIPERGCILIG
mgnify:CR=1 FL=1